MLHQFFNPIPKPAHDVSKIKAPKKQIKLRLLERAPLSFNVGLAGIWVAILVVIMVMADSVLIWGIGIPTIYVLYRLIHLERLKNKAVVEE